MLRGYICASDYEKLSKFALFLVVLDNASRFRVDWYRRITLLMLTMESASV